MLVAPAGALESVPGSQWAALHLAADNEPRGECMDDLDFGKKIIMDP